MQDEHEFDRKSLERWLDDGGYCPPDEDEAEQIRNDVACLRGWLKLAIGNEAEFHLLKDIADGSTTKADFAAELDLDRSSGKRRVDNFCKVLRCRIKNNEKLRSLLPERWRHLIGV